MKKTIFISILLMMNSATYAAEWQSYMNINSNYFEGTHDNLVVVITMESAFHTCGWNGAANLNISVLGPDSFKTLSSVILSAIMTSKRVSLKTEGCHGNRAKVVGVRIEQ